MSYNISTIIKKADQIVSDCDTRDPFKVAAQRGIEIIYRDYKQQNGAYKIILGVPFIFLKNDLDPNFERIVVWHEIGHDVLHRSESGESVVFQEFSLFNMNNRMEYEANVFAAQASIDDDSILEYIRNGYDFQQIAKALNSDTNLVALKIDALNLRGYKLYPQEHRSDFLGHRSNLGI